VYLGYGAETYNHALGAGCSFLLAASMVALVPPERNGEPPSGRA
jgi:hypothetical protein